MLTTIHKFVNVRNCNFCYRDGNVYYWHWRTDVNRVSTTPGNTGNLLDFC